MKPEKAFTLQFNRHTERWRIVRYDEQTRRYVPVIKAAHYASYRAAKAELETMRDRFLCEDESGWLLIQD